MSKIDEMIKRVRELDAAATPGPWECSDDVGWVWGVVSLHDGAQDMRLSNDMVREDAVLTAEYRTLAPKLTEMLDMAVRELEYIATRVGYGRLALAKIEEMAEGGEA